MEQYLVLRKDMRAGLLCQACENILGTSHDPLQRVRLQILKLHGCEGFLVLSHAVRKLASRQKEADIQRILDGSLSCIGLSLTEAEMMALRHSIEHVLDRRPLHFVHLVEVLVPALPAETTSVIHKAFNKMNPEATGIVTYKKLMETYNIFVEQEVFEGAISADDGMEAFIEPFKSYGTIPGYVARSEFVDYYTGVYASYVDDEQFQKMIMVAYQADQKSPDEALALAAFHSDEIHPRSWVLSDPSDFKCHVTYVHHYHHSIPSVSGIVTYKKCMETYNVFVDQEVLGGSSPTDDGMEAFIETFQSYGTVRGEIAQSEFVDSNTRVNTSYANDEQFQNMIMVRHQADQKLPDETPPITALHSNEIHPQSWVISYPPDLRGHVSYEHECHHSLSSASGIVAYEKWMETYTVIMGQEVFEESSSTNDAWVISYPPDLKGHGCYVHGYHQSISSASGIVTYKRWMETYTVIMGQEVFGGSSSTNDGMEAFTETFQSCGTVRGEIAQSDFVDANTRVKASYANDEQFQNMIMVLRQADQKLQDETLPITALHSNEIHPQSWVISYPPDLRGHVSYEHECHHSLSSASGIVAYEKWMETYTVIMGQEVFEESSSTNDAWVISYPPDLKGHGCYVHGYHQSISSASGIVTYKRWMETYTVIMGQEVFGGSSSTNDVMEAFTETFQSCGTVRGEIAQSEFVDANTRVNASYANDEQFQNMIMVRHQAVQKLPDETLPITALHSNEIHSQRWVISYPPDLRGHVSYEHECHHSLSSASGIAAYEKWMGTYNVITGQEFTEESSSTNDGMEAFTETFQSYGTVPGAIAQSEFVDSYTGVNASCANGEQFQNMKMVGYQDDQKVPDETLPITAFHPTKFIRRVGRFYVFRV